MRRTSLTTLLDTVAGMLSVMLALTAGNALAQTAADVKTRNPPPPDRFVYRSLQGVEFEVTAEGLSTIRMRGRTLASGGWTVFNAEPWFKEAGAGTVRTGPITRKSLRMRQARTRLALRMPEATSSQRPTTRSTART